jgi:uncharacterized membrane protein
MKTDFLAAIDQKRIISAIETAEKGTSGEIRIHLEPHCKEPVLNRASEVFASLHMHKTKMRNGVLIYIAYVEKQFAIIGDAGINKVVEDDFWTNEKELITSNFKEGQFTDGICLAIEGIGNILNRHFPYQKGLSGELPNDISFGDEHI